MNGRRNLITAINVTRVSTKQQTLSSKDHFDNRKKMEKKVMIIITIRRTSQIRKLIIQEREGHLKELKRRKSVKRN